MWTELIILCFFRSVEANLNEIDGEILAKKCCADDEYMQFDTKGVGTCQRPKGVAAPKEHLERVGEISNIDPAVPTDFVWLPHEFRTKEEAITRPVKNYHNILCPRSHALFIGSNETHRYRIGEKGSLIFMAKTTGGHTVELPFSNREYCIDEAKGFKSTHVYMICPCKRTRCIPKCCPIDRVLNFTGGDAECKLVEDLNWKPFPNDLELEKEITYTVLDGQFPDCVYRVQHKEEMQWPDGYGRSWFYPSTGRVFEDKEVCTDFLWHDAAPLTRTIASCARTLKVVDIRKRRAILNVIATLMMGIAIIALVHHAKRCTVHILSLCSYFVSLFFYHILLSCTLWPEEPLFPCKTTGILIYYFMLSSAAWVNTAAFNIAQNSRKLINALPEDELKRSEQTLCAFYSVYAWVVPAVFVQFTISVRGTTDVPQDALLSIVQTPRSCPDESGNFAKSGMFLYFTVPLTIMMVFVSLLCTLTAILMRKLHNITTLHQRPEDLPERSFYIKWRTIIYLALMMMVMVLDLQFGLKLQQLRNEDRGYHIFEFLTDFVEFARAAFIFFYWGSILYMKILQKLCAVEDEPVAQQPSEDDPMQRTEPAEPAIQPPSSQPGPSQAAEDAASSPESELQTPFEVIRSGWWKWKFPYPRPRSQSPAGVTVAPLTEAATTGPSQLSSRSPRARPSRLSSSPPRSGPSQPSTPPPAGPSRPSQLSTPPPRTEQPQLSSAPQTTGPPETSTSQPRTSPAHSAASSPTRASPVRALFGRTSPARTSAGSSSSSSPSSTPPRPSVHMISLNPAGPSEDLIAHEQESSV